MEIITVPRVLREKLGDNGADSLVDLLNRVSDHTRDDVLIFVEEKFEHRLSEEMVRVNQRITEEVSKVNQRITEEIAKVNQRITDEVAVVRGEVQTLRTEMHGMRADLIKWMFIFWVGQIGVILGMLFAFFK